MPVQRTVARKTAARARATKPKTQTTPKTRWTLAETMAALEKAGTAQARKTYARHGAAGPMFGVSFATLRDMVQRIGVDHDLALALWETGNFDARNLAAKIADPTRLTASDLDRWAGESLPRMCGGYASMLAAEGSQGLATAKRWLAAKHEATRCAGWGLVGQLAGRDASVPEVWFAGLLPRIEREIHDAPHAERHSMVMALIQVGGRSAALRKSALAAARRIGPVDVDHGDTSCKTPDAATYIEKAWAHARAKGFDSPTAQESGRKPPRTRC